MFFSTAVYNTVRIRGVLSYSLKIRWALRTLSLSLSYSHCSVSHAICCSPVVIKFQSHSTLVHLVCVVPSSRHITSAVPHSVSESSITMKRSVTIENPSSRVQPRKVGFLFSEKRQHDVTTYLRDVLYFSACNVTIGGFVRVSFVRFPRDMLSC